MNNHVSVSLHVTLHMKCDIYMYFIVMGLEFKISSNSPSYVKKITLNVENCIV